MAENKKNTIDQTKETPTPPEVLVIDNDEAHAEVVAESLERTGMNCHIATSGPAGIRMLEKGNFDVVITDLVMNEVDGFGVLKRAKELLPDCEVILMTGHGSVPSAVEAMQQGAFNYLLKPLNLEQLRTITGPGGRKRDPPPRQRRTKATSGRKVRI